MDKETLSNYGWIVICVLVLAVMLALATPFGTFVADGFKATYTGLFDTGDSALDVGLSAVGVTNTLECGHGRKESGDHAKLGCRHFACEDCGCVPASCGIEGHWSGDGKDHSTVNHSDHTYACECTGWIVPEGGAYTINSTKTVYNSGETLPCGYFPNGGDKYNQNEYVYTFYSAKSGLHIVGWNVAINPEISDKNQESYSQMVENINGEPVTSICEIFQDSSQTDLSNFVIPNSVTDLTNAFRGCTSLKSVPTIPSSVKDIYGAFYGCTALETVPDLSQCTQLENISWAFYQCTSLSTSPEVPCSVLYSLNAFSGKITYYHIDSCDGSCGK